MWVVASLQFLPSGQYGLCFGYCFTGPLPLCSHNGEVTFHGACFRECPLPEIKEGNHCSCAKYKAQIHVWNLIGKSKLVPLHSEIGKIHLSIEAQCDHLFYQWVTITLSDGNHLKKNSGHSLEDSVTIKIKLLDTFDKMIYMYTL